jgi:hypothetical protein
MERKGAHHMLFEHLTPFADSAALQEIMARVDHHLSLDQYEKEAGSQEIFEALASFTGEALASKMQVTAIASS